MKTLTIIVCVLVITTVCYGFNSERYHKFQMNICECRKEWDERTIGSWEMSDTDLFKCGISKDGNVLDKYGKFSQYHAMHFFEDVINHENLVTLAKEIFNKCYNHVSYQGRNVDNTEYIYQCASSIITYIRSSY